MNHRLPRLTAIAAIAATAIAAITTTITTTANASPVASEAFANANGNLSGSNGGNGWGGAWSGGGVVSAGVATMSGATAFRTLDTSIMPTAGGTLYVGYSLGADQAGRGTFSGLSFFSGNQEVLFIGGNDVYSLNVTSIASRLTTIALSSTPEFLLAQILFNSATNFTVNLFVDPDDVLGAADATYTGNFIGGTWDRVRIGSGTYSADPRPTATFDNIAIGTTRADVQEVPEPSLPALLAAAALAAFIASPRRKGTAVGQSASTASWLR